ncbi:uncharacterized protein LOC117432675 [Acipenser ruthenus]|uniref:uncharacterized protein LOC117432675 n=1 Tax=Acipenser ruthenus TaxID=7906 RepID=UPI0027419847|nr:uncharacterized protein LOC117432675 [Acipenser ruthenus]
MDIDARSWDSNPRLRIVLVGNTGTGKSASGNTILGRKEFKSEASSYSVTNVCQKRDGEVAGRSVAVVDTPDLLDSERSQPDIQRHVKDCASLSAPGPHAFLLTIQTGRFTEEEKRAVETIQEIFGKGATRHAIVLFTRGDDLENETIEEFVHKNQHLCRLVNKCGGRYHLFNNRKTSDRTQVTELLEKIESMLKENGGSWYKINPKREDRSQWPLIKNILIGAVLGAAVGAAVGAATGNSSGNGAAIGAILGVLGSLWRFLKNNSSYTFQEQDSHHSSSFTQRSKLSGGNADSELRIILIGKTENGKSASGNTILGSKQFISKPGFSSITKECVKMKGEVDGRSVAVVDTPGLYDTDLSETEALREIVKCISMSSPGPHAFLIVIQMGRFTKEERDTVDLIMKIFGEGAEKYTVVLFTRGEDLEDNETIEEFIQRGDQHLKNIVEKCGGRCHAFNNKMMSDRSQVTELLEKMESMVKENGGGCYTTEMYKKAEAAIEEEKKRIMKESPGCSEEDARKKAEGSNAFIKTLIGAGIGAGTGAVLGARIGAFGGPIGAGIGAAGGGIVAVVNDKCSIQ